MTQATSNLQASGLSDRYEIRQLEQRHVEWVAAIAAHANVYQGWCATLFAGQQARTTLAFAQSAAVTYKKTVELGFSYGIFDKEYQFKRVESVAAGGGLYFSEFDESDPELEVDSREKLNDAMDFPLVSYGMQYDASDPSPATILFTSLVKEVPVMGYVFGARPALTAEERAKREAEPDKSLEVKPNWGEVMGRNGTATKEEYAGKGLAKALAHWLLSDAKRKGYKKMVIGVNSLAVHHIYSNPPAPFKANVLMAYHCQDHEVEIDGKMVKLFANCKDAFRGSVEVLL
ncbi:hypothetical protein NQ176_g10036 [Zarea fungicola]|uniref:Uncharacterized protein n=1 Tax=Zarea fungicola TaxID=93591 RepID=A0ACC1MKC2_9HYPO|nr:hypothetical protein NQ176_g10036 [Lecanicillium fungicola]